MTRTVGACVLLLLAGAAAGPAGAGTPVGWRNDGTGRFPEASPPTQWSAEKNVVWKVALPGTSHATPVVVGDRLFVVSDPAELLCVSRSDGKVLWRKANNDVKAPAARGGFGRGGRGRPGGFGPRGPGRFGPGGMGGAGMSAGNSAATPASDGKHVGVVFGNGVVAVYTTEGKRLWARHVESSRIGFGHSASPLLLGGKLIVHVKDLVALDVATGKEAWRVALPAAHASPVAARLGKDDVVISPAGAVVRARDGKVLARGEFRASQSSPVLDGDTIYLFGRTLAAHKLSLRDGEVSVTSLWSRPGAREMHHLPSPVVHDGLVYGVTTAGFLDVLDVKTGKAVYRQRLGLGQVYSSVTLAGGLLYVIDTRGKAVVFKPGRRFERVAVNQLESVGSCPVFDGDRLYVRGQRHLYCLGAPGSRSNGAGAP